jgi:opacity protein-like surface antigen
MGRTAGKLCSIICLAVMLVLAGGTTGWAFVGIKAGAFMPNSDEKGLKDFDTGTAVEVSFGKDFGLVGIEVGAGYLATSHSTFDVDLTVVPILATAKLSFKPSEALGLYLGGGAGYYLATLDGPGDSEDDAAVGFHAVGGVDVPLGPVILNGEVRWSQAEPDFDGDDKVNIGGLTVTIGLKF